MKKLLLLFILSILILSCDKKDTELEVIEKETPEVTQNDNTTEQVTNEEETKPLIEISKEDVLQIWYRADGAPGMFVDENGNAKGFYIDLEKAIMKEMGQKYNFNPYSDLGPLIQNIKSGTAHSALATVDVPDYRALANISTTFEVLDYYIFISANNNDIVPTNIDEAIKYLNGKKVGVQTRAHIYQLLRDHKEIEIVEYPTTTVAMEALHNGEVDAVPEVKRIGVLYAKEKNWAVKPVGAPIFSQDIGTGFSKVVDTSVVDRYNKALQTLIDNGYVADLYNSYFGG